MQALIPSLSSSVSSEHGEPADNVILVRFLLTLVSASTGLHYKMRVLQYSNLVKYPKEGQKNDLLYARSLVKMLS